MLHEGGHAVHCFLTRRLPLCADKHPPSEVAELASMSMELMSMDHWDVFFEDPADLRRAKKTPPEGVLETFPWVATIDKFQHWVYEHPAHTEAERHQRWTEIFDRVQPAHRELERPGAVPALPSGRSSCTSTKCRFTTSSTRWRSSGPLPCGAIIGRTPPPRLAGYQRALALGYTVPIGEMYAAAGIRFDFSTEYLRQLADFVREEMASL
ncbi:MAG: M3 family metallopeptidase [Hymenobacter sp.]